jgi:hypothetical protein
LLHEYVFGSPDECEYVLLGEFDEFAWFGSAYLEECFDDLVNVDFYLLIHGSPINFKYQIVHLKI